MASQQNQTPSPFPTLNLEKWIRENRQHFKPPVANKQLFPESLDAIVFVSGGPNTRNDFHVNPTEEFFYQLRGDIAVRVRPLDGSPPRDVIIREGEVFLLPRWVPHRPQRPAGTLGLIIEFPRGLDAHGQPQEDALRWYCPACGDLVHEARWVLKKIDEDLKVIMNEFWDGPVQRRTCRRCGTVINRASEVELRDGRVTSSLRPAAPAAPSLKNPQAPRLPALKPPQPKPAPKPIAKPAAAKAAPAKPSPARPKPVKSGSPKPAPAKRPAAKPGASARGGRSR